MAGLSAGDFKPVQASDFKPAANTDSGVAASDFKSISASDFRSVGSAFSQTPIPIATPHQYDGIIAHNAKKFGLDPNVLRAVGMQESGLGTGSNYNPKTGLDKDSNKGHGLFQLDPASGATPDSLARAAKDPEFASSTAAQMLAKNLKATGGDLRKALAMYNAGNPDSPQGLAYADQVMQKMQRLDPIKDQSIFGQISRDFKKIQNQVKHGKPIGKALAATPTGRQAAKAEGNLRTGWDYARQHPVTSLLDVLGGPQRAIGGIADAVEKHEDFKNALHSTLDAVFHPTEENQQRTTESIRALAHAPTHEAIDSWVKGHVKNSFAPYVANALKTGEDIGLQTASDPLSFLGEGAFKTGATVAGKLGKASFDLLDKAGVGKYFKHLPLMDQAHNTLMDIFGKRRDLDYAGFTKQGKQARMAIENRVDSEMSKHASLDNKAAESADESEKRIVEYARQHGSPQKAAQAAAHPFAAGKAHANPTGSGVFQDLPTEIANIRNMTPEERLARFAQIRKEIGRNELARISKNIIGNNPKLIKNQITNWHSIGDGNNYKVNIGGKTYDWQGMADTTKRLRNLGKAAVFTNPLAHGVHNVGELAYWAGGLPAVAKGVAGLIKGVNPQTVERLHQMGAAASYVKKDYKGPFAGYMKAMDASLTHMEHAWRAGVLSELDRKLGPSTPGSLEEYLKGYMVNHKVGDYKNVSAFVKFFKALGGPFVAFRLGIVPEKFLETLASKPGRLATSARVSTDIQQNRSHQGQFKNHLNVGGPIEDAGKLATNPVGYLSSPSTTGPFGWLTELGDNNKTWLQKAADLGEAYVSGAEDIQRLTESAQGSAMPGQHMSFGDAIMSAIEQELGAYFSKEKTPKQWNTEQKKNRKAGL